MVDSRPLRFEGADHIKMLNQVRIVLVGTTHPGNIGGAARAMKTMGLSSLYLVSPELFPHGQATAMASGADDLLANATVVDTLAEAIADCTLVFGTSARSRTLPWPVLAPHEFGEKALSHIQANKGVVACVFGREHSGLDNHELAQCQFHVQIPSVSDFSSLNLAQAVQVLSFVLREASLKTQDLAPQKPERKELASGADLDGFFQHLESTLVQYHFLDPKHPKKLMRRLMRLFYRAELDRTEVNILRGILHELKREDAKPNS